ncbi:MAG TPA: MFS transporter [Candidatus Paceibacterota bacterium]|nr:MFS transporter [Candidatus Paceibacterota bacterium]
MTDGTKKTTASLLSAFSGFWLFIVLYRFAAVLHYSLLSPLGERLLPLWVVGVLIGTASFLQMLLDVPAGHLVDRFGKKRMLAIGWVAFVTSAFFLTRFSFTNFLLSVAFSVIGWLFYAPGMNAYILAYAKKETSGRFLALRDTFGSLGVVLASVSLPFVLLYSPLFMGDTLIVLFVFAIIALFLSPPDKPSPHTESVLPAEPYHIRRTDVLKSFRALKRLNPASGTLCAFTFASAIFYGAIWFVVPLIIAANVSGQQILGFGLAVFDLSIVLFGVLIGAFVDRGDKSLLVFYGLSLFAIIGLITGTTFGPLFLLFGFLASTGDEIARLSLWSWLHALDTEHAHDGAVAGVISFSNDFGYAVGPILAGFIFSVWGPTWTIAISALPLLATWIRYTVYVRPKAFFPSSLIDIPRMPMHRRHKS